MTKSVTVLKWRFVCLQSTPDLEFMSFLELKLFKSRTACNWEEQRLPSQLFIYCIYLAHKQNKQHTLRIGVLCQREFRHSNLRLYFSFLLCKFSWKTKHRSQLVIQLSLWIKQRPYLHFMRYLCNIVTINQLTHKCLICTYYMQEIWSKDFKTWPLLFEVITI